MHSSLTLHCPACGSRIRARLGCHGEFLAEAVRLQSARCGTEFRCHECRLHHVVIRVDVSEGMTPTGKLPP